ncbi:hypothetical protein IQ273_31740 [Nodosilinea sp. LEGE 07298]|uniref:hypothetical protein n=1 Tax=Nodosilinea sp. LEGE 07298 TaxID=2777970 RepID=UPI001880E750|nr:hypothetical protein [Nodosilinea sp. LEGE 07298]MBE9113945.1 hypothetical protein [Nodosilinea sp. LEGE 07298]
MSFEAAYLAALEGAIARRGGSVPPMPYPTSFSRRSLQLYDSLLATAGALAVPDRSNYPASVLAKLAAAIVALGGAVPPEQINYYAALLAHLEALALASGGEVAGLPSNFYERAIAVLERVQGFDFSALSALPSARRLALITAATAAASALSVSVQSVIDALAVGRGLASLLPEDGCLLASSGGAVTVQGDPVGAVRSWTGVELSVQPNASLRPASISTGISGGSGTKSMFLGDLSAWTEGEGLVVFQATSTSGFWRVGTQTSNSHEELIPWSSNRVFINFGQDQNRSLITGAMSSFAKTLYSVRAANGSRTVKFNGGADIVHSPITIGFSATAEMMSTLTQPFYGYWSAMVLNPVVYTASERDAVREFCRNYYGPIY